MFSSNVNISVITPIMNNAGTIRDCIESVQKQTVSAQHIIIDGVSSDGSLELIKELASGNSIVISEPDKSEYDAMNKGLRLAAGDIVGILNADDFYAHEKVLEKVCNIFSDADIGACYGDLVYVDPLDVGKIKRHWKSGIYNKNRFYWGWMPPHPTFFFRRNLLHEYGYFRLDLPIAADYEFMLRYLVKYEIVAAYIAEVLVMMRTGGKSNVSLKHRLIAHRCDKLAWKLNGLQPRPWTLALKPISKIGQYFFPNSRCALHAGR